MQGLPSVNALLNAVSALLLAAGFYFVKRRSIALHRRCMLAAFVTSTLFLGSYLTYHVHRTYVTGLGPTRFTGEGLVRPFYFSVLISHTILAMAVVPLVFVALYRAWSGDFQGHARVARWTLPVWFYVSVTGVVVYLMLYHLYPSG